MSAPFRMGVIAAAVSKGYATGVTLLLHFNGSDGATTTVDSSTNANTVTLNNGAQLSTARAKYGASSLLLDGSNDYVLVTDDPSLVLAGDFTVEGWMYLTALGGNRSLIHYYNASLEFQVYIQSGGGGRLNLYSNVGGSVIVGSTTATLNAWVHWAWTRQGTTHKLWLDGTLVGSYTGPDSPLDPTGLFIGCYGGPGGPSSEFFVGNLDDIRVTVGTALYTGTSPFTPPTSEFPNP